MSDKSNIPPQQRAATLADVGKIAGVSAMAASAVLNGSRTSSRISEETRKRILSAARKLNYRPNVAARSLVNRRMNTLGVTVMMHKEELNLYFLEVFNGILEEAMQNKQNTTVFTIPDWSHFEPIADFCDGRIDGMILVGPLFEQDVSTLIPANTPFVSLHSNRPMAGIPNLESDEEHGAYMATRQLISTGRRKFMHVCGPSGLLGTERRKRGFLHALNEAGIDAKDAILLQADFSMEHTFEIFSKWMETQPRDHVPDAIFAVNDASALACVEVLVGAGYKVPEDVSVFGFDDSLAARSAHLSSVRQPLREMGNQAVKILLDMIDGIRVTDQTQAPESILFKTELRVRNT